MMNPQRTIDLRSVAYSEFFWRNQFGETVRCKPRKPTVHGQVVPNELAPAYPSLFGHKEYVGETMLQRATRLGLVDRWTPVCIYQFRNNHSLRFEGKKAQDKHQAYNKHIYG